MENKKTALIVGMARSGIAATKLLYQNGYNIIINDIKAEIEGLFDALSGIKYTDALGWLPETLLDGVDLMVLTPVIPIFSPFAKEAKARGIEVIGEIELGYRFSNREAKFVCISGTNGKTTTTAMTGEIFKAGGRHTFVLGNIGIPISEYAMETKPGDYIVAETAALQLESIDTFHPNAFAMLNISEDHLNRFEFSMDKYIAAKCRGFENQTETDFAILNYDDPIVREMAALTKAKTIYFSSKQELDEGMFLRGDDMIWRQNGVEAMVARTDDLRVPGAHNVENALCASALALCQGVDAQSVREGLSSFGGVEHRIEFVRELDGVIYYNDSKGTNPESTIKAVEAMARPTILLLGVGNYDKKSDFLPLFEAFGGRIKHVIASGVNTPAIFDAASHANFGAITAFEDERDLLGLIECARDMAKPGDAILLSPAAASWGVFSDYEERGRMFKHMVSSLRSSDPLRSE